jgi:hypothetical protein
MFRRSMLNNNYRLLFIGFSLVYLFLSIVPPTDPTVLQQYEITQERAHLIRLAVAIPFIIIWLAALHGVTKFKEYADAIKDSKEGPWFGFMSRGLLVLVIGLPILASLGSYTSYVRYADPESLPGITIIKNYISLLFPLVAFMMIAKGAEGLMRTLKAKDVRISPKLGLLCVITLSSVYTWLLVTSPVADTGDNVYFIPNALVIFTLAIPYLFVWCKGLVAAYHLYVYKNRVKGRIYRKGLASISKGIAVIIILSVVVQIVLTMSMRILSLNLSPILFIIYLLVALTAVGYGLVARGSRKLKQIEEV